MPQDLKISFVNSIADVSVSTRKRYCTEDQIGGKSGQISSPGYPDEYQNNVNFTRIISFGATRTRVNFTILDLDAETKGAGCYDYLKVNILLLIDLPYLCFRFGTINLYFEPYVNF